MPQGYDDVDQERTMGAMAKEFAGAAQDVRGRRFRPPSRGGPVPPSGRRNPKDWTDDDLDDLGMSFEDLQQMLQGGVLGSMLKGGLKGGLYGAGAAALIKALGAIAGRMGPELPNTDSLGRLNEGLMRPQRPEDIHLPNLSVPLPPEGMEPRLPDMAQGPPPEPPMPLGANVGGPKFMPEMLAKLLSGQLDQSVAGRPRGYSSGGVPATEFTAPQLRRGMSTGPWRREDIHLR